MFAPQNTLKNMKRQTTGEEGETGWLDWGCEGEILANMFDKRVLSKIMRNFYNSLLR